MEGSPAADPLFERMPQVLKEEVRRRILQGGLEEFAANGFVGATMASIAARAELGAATLYRYYASKEELFAAVVPAELAEQFETLLERRVRALGPSAKQANAEEAQALLAFWFAHRLAIVILLDRARGTAYERYGERFVELLTALTLKELRRERPGLRLSAPDAFVLRRIFENTRGLLAAVLEAHADEAELREAIETFWSYQLAGLGALSRRLVAK